jgi:hypothetical protein
MTKPARLVGLVSRIMPHCLTNSDIRVFTAKNLWRPAAEVFRR